MRNFRESPPPPLPAFRAAQVWNLLAPDPRFRENKMGVHATSHGKDLNPAFGGVSDRVKLSRLRRQIRTLSAFLPFFTCAMAVRMAVHGCQVGLNSKAWMRAFSKQPMISAENFSRFNFPQSAARNIGIRDQTY